MLYCIQTMKDLKEINKLIKHLNDNHAYPVNGHIFVVPYDDEKEEELEQRGGIFIPSSSGEKNGSGMFVKLVVVSLQSDSPALSNRCGGKVEFNVGDVCYGVGNTLTHRECYIEGEKVFCIDPHQIVAVIGRVK